jgi:hypothetical protein
MRISLPRFIMVTLSTCLSQIATAASTSRFSDASLREKRPDRAFRIIRLWPTNIYEQQSLLTERPPPGFRKCVQVVREPAEWPTKLIQIKSAHLGAE